MEENRKKFGILGKMELISAIGYLCTGLVLPTFVGGGIVSLTLCLWMVIFTILLIIFMKHHVYRKDKPLLTALSIYYKSLVYVLIIFNISGYQGTMYILGIAMVSIIIYMILSYINGKQYSQMLNAYLYLCMMGCFQF